MSELKTIRVLGFSGNTSNWDGWSKKFMEHGKSKGYRKILQGKEQFPTNREYELITGLGSSKEDEKVKKNGDLNDEAYEDIILSIAHTTK